MQWFSIKNKRYSWIFYYIPQQFPNIEVEPQQSEVQLQPKESEEKSFFLGNSMIPVI